MDEDQDLRCHHPHQIGQCSHQSPPADATSTIRTTSQCHTVSLRMGHNQAQQPNIKTKKLPNSCSFWMNFENDYVPNAGISPRYAPRPFQPKIEDYSVVCVHGCPIAETLFSTTLRLVFFASTSSLNILSQHYACTLFILDTQHFLHSLPLWALTHGSVLTSITVSPKFMPGCL